MTRGGKIIMAGAVVVALAALALSVVAISRHGERSNSAKMASVEHRLAAVEALSQHLQADDYSAAVATLQKQVEDLQAALSVQPLPSAVSDLQDTVNQLGPRINAVASDEQTLSAEVDSLRSCVNRALQGSAGLSC
jgi:chaperonin cofactor prefoldin